MISQFFKIYRYGPVRNTSDLFIRITNVSNTVSLIATLTGLTVLITEQISSQCFPRMFTQSAHKLEIISWLFSTHVCLPGSLPEVVCEVWLCLADEVMQEAYDLLPMSHLQLWSVMMSPLEGRRELGWGQSLSAYCKHCSTGGHTPVRWVYCTIPGQVRWVCALYSTLQLSVWLALPGYE